MYICSMFGVRLSEISNTMSLQYQAALSALHDETKPDKKKIEEVPMYAHADIAIENLLHAETHYTQNKAMDAAIESSSQAVSEAAASQLSKNFIEIENLIKETLSKPVSQDNPETVGTTLANLSESIQKDFEAAHYNTGKNLTDQHPKVTIGGGFVIDLINGTISFDISMLLKKRNSEESSNEFIRELKERDNKKPFPTFQDVLKEIGKVPAELKLDEKLDTEKQTAVSALRKFKEQTAELSSAYSKIDSEKALNLLY